MTLSAALFDIDGTLVDSNFLHVEAWAHAFHEAGLSVPAWQIQRAIGADAMELLGMLIGDESDATKERVRALNSDYYRELQPRITVFPGARELLAELAGRGIRVVLATSAPPGELSALLEALDVGEFTYAVTGAEDVDKAKPEPQLVEVAVSRAQVGTAETVMIGDSVWDVTAAARAGVPSIGLLSGGTDRETLRRAGALEVYDEVADLHRHLDDSRFFSHEA